jgi:hypothetical protein
LLFALHSGDSITAGYGNEGVPPCHFTPQTENNYL